MRYYKKNKKILNILISVVLSIGLIFGIAALVKNLSDDNKDLKNVKLNWEIGSLNEVGKQVETDQSVYTYDSFDCFGLAIEFDFDAHVEVEVIYYDEDDQFVGKLDTVLTETTPLYVPEGAERARLVLTPDWDAEIEAEDMVIKWHSINKYTSQITVKNAKGKLNDLEVAYGVYKLDEVDVEVSKTLTNFGEDYYRIFVKDNKIVTVAKLGTETKENISADSVIALNKDCVFEDVLELVKEIVNSDDVKEFKVNKYTNADSTITYYFSTNADALTNYVNSLK